MNNDVSWEIIMKYRIQRHRIQDLISLLARFVPGVRRLCQYDLYWACPGRIPGRRYICCRFVYMWLRASDVNKHLPTLSQLLLQFWFLKTWNSWKKEWVREKFLEFFFLKLNSYSYYYIIFEYSDYVFLEIQSFLWVFTGV